MNVNNRKKKSNKFPATALAFYIKVYCKQKASTKTKYCSKLVEATKSWLSLSDSEKQEVIAKYDDCQQKYNMRFIDQLKNAEPFMKAKVQRKEDRLNNSRVGTPISIISQAYHDHEDIVEELKAPGEPVEQSEQSTELALVYDEQESNVNQIQNDQNVNTERTNDQNEYDKITPIPEPLPLSYSDQIQNTVESFDRNENYDRILVEEPLPPTFKTGKDLFQLLNTVTHSGDETDRITWNSLPQFEKNQYSRAVCLLKKDYLTKYREYLESLSPKELFEYYHKTVA